MNFGSILTQLFLLGDCHLTYVLSVGLHKFSLHDRNTEHAFSPAIQPCMYLLISAGGYDSLFLIYYILNKTLEK